MAAIPGFLLRHTVTVEPYLGTWGKYGPAAPLRCFVQQGISGGSRTASGARHLMITIIARIDAAPLVPEGSRITLADGVKGFAAAVALHDAGGLPTPDHIEVSMTVGLPSYGAPMGGEVVVLLRRVKTGQNLYHNDVYGVVEVPVVGCAVNPLGSSEQDTGGRDKTVDTIEVTMPADTVVNRIDRLRVRGIIYDVQGTPEPIHNPITGADGGLRVIGKRVTG
jgi:hypothetical protein